MPNPRWLAAGGIATAWAAPWMQVQLDPHPLQPQNVQIGEVHNLPVVVHRRHEGVDLLRIILSRMESGRLLRMRYALAAALVMVEVAVRVASRAGTDHDLVGGVGPHRLRVGVDGTLQLDCGFASSRIRGPLAPTMRLSEYAYLPPETVAGEVAGAAADVWAVGLTLHHAAVGWNPMQGAEVGETFTTILAGTAEVGWSFLDPGLRELVKACLSRTPWHRPRMGRQLHERLTYELDALGGPPRQSDWRLLVSEVVGNPGWTCEEEEAMTAPELLEALSRLGGLEAEEAHGVGGGAA